MSTKEVETSVVAKPNGDLKSIVTKRKIKRKGKRKMLEAKEKEKK